MNINRFIYDQDDDEPRMLVYRTSVENENLALAEHFLEIRPKLAVWKLANSTKVFIEALVSKECLEYDNCESYKTPVPFTKEQCAIYTSDNSPVLYSPDVHAREDLCTKESTIKKDDYDKKFIKLLSRAWQIAMTTENWSTIFLYGLLMLTANYNAGEELRYKSGNPTYWDVARLISKPLCIIYMITYIYSLSYQHRLQAFCSITFVLHEQFALESPTQG
jgi:hypothetical protein